MANDLTLSIRLQADGSQLTGQVRSAADQIASLGGASDKAAGGIEHVGQASRQAGSEASRLNEESKKLSEGLNKIGEVAELAKQALEAVGAVEFFKQVIEHATNLKRMSLELGLSTDALQELNHAAMSAGLGVEQLSTGLRRQSTFVMAAAEGQKTAAEAMNKLNISAAKLMELPVDIQMQKLGAALLGVTNATEQNRIAIELWGRTGLQVLAIMREHGAALSDVREEAHQAGVVMSSETITTLQRLGVQAKETAEAWLVGIGDVVAAIAGPLMSVLKILAEYPAAIGAAWNDATEAITRHIRAAGSQGTVNEANEQIRLMTQQVDTLKQHVEQLNAIPLAARSGSNIDAQIASETKQIQQLTASMQAEGQTEGIVANASKAYIDAQAKRKQAYGDEIAALNEKAKALAATNVAGQNDIATRQGQTDGAEKYLASLKEELEKLQGHTDASQRAAAATHVHTQAQLDQAVALLKQIDNYKELGKELDAASKAEEDLNKKYDAAKKSVDSYLEGQREELANLVKGNAERQAEKALRSQLTNYTDQQKAAILAEADANAQAIEQAKTHLDTLKAFATTIRDGFTTAFEDIFTKGKNGFQDLVDSIKKWFLKLLADMALMAAANPIRMVLTTAAGWMGMENPEAAAGGVMQQMMPYGNLFGTGAQAAGINPYQYVQSLFQTSTATPTAGLAWNPWSTGMTEPGGTFGTTYGAGVTSGGGWGSTLGSVLPIFGGGLMGWGIGGTMAGLTGGNVTGGNWGGLAGGAGGAWAGAASGIGAGAMWGSVVPIIGTVIGAILGGLLGGLFGGGDDDFQTRLVTNKKWPLPGLPGKAYEDATTATGAFGPIGFLTTGADANFDATKYKDFLNAIAQIDNAFAQFLSPQEVESVKQRLADMTDAEFTNSFNAVTALKQRFEEMLSAVDPQLKKVYDSFHITADNAGNFAVALLGLRKEVQDLNTLIAGTATDPVQQFKDQIQALDTSLQQAADAGRKALAENDPTKIAQAEQTLQQAVVARYQYEMQIATQLQQVIQGLTATIAGLQQQMYQLRVSEYKDWLDINQRINATGGGGVTQLSIYRQAGAELLGAYQGATDPQQRLDMLKQGMEIVDQGLAARMTEIDDWVKAQQQAAQERIAGLQQEKTQIQAAAQARIAGLQQELQLAQQWASILSQATSALDQMRYGGANPLSAFARLQFAQSDLSSTTDPNRRLQLLQTLGSLGGEAYQRPSPEYQAIYNQVVAGLTDLQSQAQAQAAHAAQLQEQIAAANTEMQASLASIDQQIAQLSDQTAIQRQAAQMQAQARSEANTYYQWIEQQGAKDYAALQKQLADQIAANQSALAQASAQMDLLTAGAGYQVFIKQNTDDMVGFLKEIRNDLKTYLGEPLTKRDQATVQAQRTGISKQDIDQYIPYIAKKLKTA